MQGISFLCRIFLVFILLMTADVCSAAGNFVPVKLAYGVSVELPRNWVAISNNQRITLDSSVQAKTELAGDKYYFSDLNFAANYYDDRNNTAGIFNIRFYPDQTLTQADARAATAADARDIDEVVSANMRKSEKMYGVKVLSWIGTKKTSVNGIVAFITEYRRAGLTSSSPFRVRLVRVFNGKRTFTVTVSYREDQEVLLRPICDRIIQSIRI